ncbi:MAG: hypothetical protein R3284_12090 [Rubricoccaceae bacterium]|nr:hypothetical protein [Rubricoccaceae bacterium]
MSTSNEGKSLLRGAREALDYARGTRQGYVVHVPQREALFVVELTDEELEAIARAEVPPGYDHLDQECED